jgi:hypothetical protein
MESTVTPQESIETGYAAIKSALGIELLTLIKSVDPIREPLINS